MKCIVPLAGPDFYDESYGIKPTFDIDGVPLIERTLGRRSWYVSGELSSEDIIFVVRDTKYTERVIKYLRSSFSHCSIVIIDRMTKGAVLSVVSGLGLIKDFNVPIVVDLVDIIFDQNVSPTVIFAENDMIGGILPYFESSSDKYSYLIIDEMFVLKTVEKKVISNHASAGTYFYRNIQVLLNAFNYSFANENKHAVNNNLFLCPTFNGIIQNNFSVKAIKVNNVQEVSLLFH